MNKEETKDSKTIKVENTSLPPVKRVRKSRIPVASANGNELAKLNDNTGGKRKRVRINVGQNSNNKLSSHRYKISNDSLEDLAGKEEKDIKPKRNYEEEYARNRRERRFDQKVYPNFTNTKTKRPQSKPKVKNDTRKNASMPTPIKIKEVLPDDIFIRLNKYIANSGVCSRREADIMIAQGKVTVNGEVVTELGKRVRPIDEIICQGKNISIESKVYLLLNKPKNCVTTLDDPESRTTVMDIVKNACSERIYPVGRLDRNTMGVLLLTNDGDLATKLAHPSYMKKKIYHVWLNKPVSTKDMQMIVDGIELEDGIIHADALSYVKEDDKSQVGIEIHSGRNRIVRRIFEKLGYKVVKLDRVYFAGLTKKNLPRGRWRFLNEQEVINLKNGLVE